VLLQPLGPLPSTSAPPGAGRDAAAPAESPVHREEETGARLLDHPLPETAVEALLATVEEPLSSLIGTLQPLLHSAACDIQTPLGAPHGLTSHALTPSFDPAPKKLLPALETPHLPFDAVSDGLRIGSGRHSGPGQQENCDDSPEWCHSFLPKQSMLRRGEERKSCQTLD
jgi:hypothetical protein